MVRKRTGSAAPDGAEDDAVDDLPDEIDPLTEDAADAMARPATELPAPAGSLKVLMKGQWRDGDEWKPPGIYTMTREDALHYVSTGAAEVKA